MSNPSESPSLVPPVSESDHRRGTPDARHTLVEYGDYECPSCARAHVVLRALQQRFGRELCLVFRNFPLTQSHPHAMRAAEAGEAAAEQGRFWEMHDRLLEHQDTLDDAGLLEHARGLGLDIQRFARALASGAHIERVREHFLSGVRSGVSGTPTFFVDGRRHDGPWDEGALARLLARVPGAAGETERAPVDPARREREDRRRRT
jgi:protein-disulfide isomerase